MMGDMLVLFPLLWFFLSSCTPSSTASHPSYIISDLGEKKEQKGKEQPSREIDRKSTKSL